MAEKRLKLKAESSTKLKPRPSVPSSGKGPRTEIPKWEPKGPKVPVSRELAKEVSNYKPNAKPAPSGVRGTPEISLRPKQIPAKLSRPITLEERAASRMYGPKTPSVETPKAESKPTKFMTRAQVEKVGVQEKVSPSVRQPGTPIPKERALVPYKEPAPKPKFIREYVNRAKVVQPKPLQLSAGNIPPKPTSTVTPKVKAATSVTSKVKQGVKAFGKALVQEQTPRLTNMLPEGVKKAIGRGAEVAEKSGLIKRTVARVGKTLATSRLAARVAGRLAGPVGLAMTAKDMYGSLESVAKEQLKAQSALQDLDNSARALTKKGYKVTRPEVTKLDYVKALVVPNASFPGPEDIKVYEPKKKKKS